MYHSGERLLLLLPNAVQQLSSERCLIMHCPSCYIVALFTLLLLAFMSSNWAVAATQSDLLKGPELVRWQVKTIHASEDMIETQQEAAWRCRNAWTSTQRLRLWERRSGTTARPVSAASGLPRSSPCVAVRRCWCSTSSGSSPMTAFWVSSAPHLPSQR